MLEPRRLKPLIVLPLLAGILLAMPDDADAKCRPKHVRTIERYTKKALEDYQMLEIGPALKRITKAVDYGMDNDCDESPAYARALMIRGIIYLAGQQDKTRAQLYFEKAIKANACVKLDAGQPPEVSKLWNKVRKRLRSRTCGDKPAPRPDRPDPPPTSGKPCEHTSVDEAMAGKSISMVVRVTSEVGAAKVIVFYRPHGKASFSKLMLQKPASGDTWSGLIPGSDVSGVRLAYYIEVQNASGTVVCSPIKATAGAPEIIMIKGDPCRNLPPDFCETSKDHKCCKKPDPGPGPGPGPGGKKGLPRFYLSAGFALGVGLLSTSMVSDLEKTNPYEAGLALGPIGGQLEFGYFLAKRHLLTLTGRFGVSFSDVSDTPVLSFQALLRYRFYAVGGGKKDIFSLYLGAQVGGAILYHSLVVTLADERDTFKHGYAMIGAVIGVAIGSQRVAWYVEADPGGVFPKQSTFVLGVSSGVALRF
ncbi:MAG: hypothetical protein ABI333_11685 [bacterium]